MYLKKVENNINLPFFSILGSVYFFSREISWMSRIELSRSIVKGVI